MLRCPVVNAPCGHPGEVVVGTYVRCIRGCEGAAPPSKRGIEGHVRDCACAACKVCHRVSWFATRTKAGDDSVKLYWGGKAESTGAALSMYLPDGKLRHLNAVDTDGRVLASHPISFDARAGDKLDFTFDPMTLSFSSVKHWGKSRLSDFVKLTISQDLPKWKDLYATIDHATRYRAHLMTPQHIKRKDVQFGEVYMLRVGMMHGHTGWADGRVRVVSLLVDNTDDAPAPYYEAVVRFIDPTHKGYRDLRLCGPQIDYHLWTL